ncbi:uncharacterized protein LOC141631315 [Silene latifolia]|uniref:uncharacterized protein LOC141631315 n=1 Tax=Silene latifolia TaxID=37657 RepID=UPI003D788627
MAGWVWDGIGLGNVTEEGGNGVRDWIEACWKNMEGGEHEKFMVGCWAIWELRNKVVFEGAEAQPEKVIRRVRDVLDEGAGRETGERDSRGVRLARERREGQEGELGWRAAGKGCVKINVDAGTKVGEGVGVGVVCRDNARKVLWGLTIVRDQQWEPEMAEAMAILDGLQEAAVRGHRRVEMESDCLVVIEALKAKKIGRSMVSLVLEDILILSNSFNFVSWLHTSRINNCVAHELAHPVPRIVGRFVWAEALPPSANAAALFDISTL